MSRLCTLPALLVLATLALHSGGARAQAPAAAPPFLSQPDIHGDRIAFVSEGDIWLGSLSDGRAVRLTRDEGAEETPRFSPDGQTIAYGSSFDGGPAVYTIPLSGGIPRRVTYRNDNLDLLDWTPDASRVVIRSGTFVAGTPALTVPVKGGYAARLPLETAGHISYSPDGKRFAFTRFYRDYAAWFRYEGGMKNDIWVGDPEALTFRKVHQAKGSSEFPAWVGDRIYFIANEEDGFSLVSVKPDGGDRKRLVGPVDMELRELQSDGKRLIYQKGIGLEVFDPATGKASEVRLELASDLMHARAFRVPPANHFSYAHLGPTGKRVLVESRGQILSLPAKEGDVRVLLAKDGVRYQKASLSPDARKLAYVSDETREQQLYVAEPDGSNPKALTKDGARQLTGVSWSPDGKWLVLADSETRLRLVNASNGDVVDIARGAWWSAPAYSFSPDSRWLAYVELDRTTYQQSLALYEITTGARTLVRSDFGDDFAPSFSRDGKWLAFLSRRSITPRGDAFLNQLSTDRPVKAYLLALKKETASPLVANSDEETPKAEEKKPEEPKKDEPKKDEEKKPDAKPEEKKDEAKKDDDPKRTEIDLDGLAERFIEIPVAAGDYGGIEMVGDRILLIGQMPPSSGARKSAVTYYDLKEKKGGTVAESLDGFHVSADDKKVLLVAGPGGEMPILRIVDVTATDVKPTDGVVDMAGVTLRINPRAEWEQMYWDAWRLIRDYFYVKNMHGVDWPEVGKKYAAYLPSVRSRGELNRLIHWMLAELNISHAWVYGGAPRASGRFTPQPSFLGIDVKGEPGGYYQITRIFRGDNFSEAERSPLAAPGLNVKEGDYLIEIAGVAAREGEDFLQGLLGRAGQVVAIKVNDKPSTEGARTIRVRPVSDERRMRYLDWVRERREYVRNATQGKIGYIHLDAMTDGDMADFIKQYFPQRGKDALIIDDRFNGGGYISNSVINLLKQRLVLYFNQRSNPQPWTRQSDYFPGPLACLMNEYSGSNGEEFPHHFRTLGLGPVIGRRTWGGEVGSDPGWPLADGGVVAVPNYGAWTPKDGWVIEGRGLEPDYDVESDPNAYARGKDPQADKAIELLQAELKKNPVRRPTQPPDPVRVRKVTGR